MDSEKLNFISKLLFRTFVIGLILASILFVVTSLFWETWSGFLARLFKIEEKKLGELVVNSFLNLRIFLVFMLLAPAIALTTMKEKK